MINFKETTGRLFRVPLLLAAVVPLVCVGASAGMKGSASSEERAECAASNALDGNMATRWASVFEDNQWIEADVGEVKDLTGLTLFWESAYGKKYDVLLSRDGKEWKKVFSQGNGLGGAEDIDFEKCAARHIKLVLKERGTGWGFSLFEIAVKTEDEPFGIGQKDPDIIVKKKWNFNITPERKIYIPKSWKGEDVNLLLSALPEDYNFYIDKKLVARVKKSKGPARLDLTKYVRAGASGYFSVEAKRDSPGNNILRSLLIVKGSELERLNELKKSNAKEYYMILAELYSEGYFPLWLIDKQDYWTVVGTEESYEESLISSKGILNAYKGGFSLMPFIYMDNELVTFADVKVNVSLEKDYLPIPEVKWQYKKVDFRQKLFAYGKENESATYLIYKLKNNGVKKVKGKLFIALRPFDVCPPWMHGGLTQIASVETADGNKVVKINGNRGIVSLPAPDGFGAASYNDEDIILSLSKGEVPAQQSLKDPSGQISASLAYHFELEPGKENEILLIVPVDGDINHVVIRNRNEFYAQYERARKSWEEKLNRIEINIPEKTIFNAMRSNIAYILINKDGPALQPGSRSYNNSWIRDGAKISAALLRTSYPEVSKRYLEWLSKTQTPEGEIPCIVNARTEKLTDYAKEWREYDASGEFVFAVADYYRFTQDKEFAKTEFPVVEKALKFVEKLRATMLKEEYKGTPSYGILPKNHSHEGYLTNPQQSLYDDFWTLRGWRDGQMLAKTLGRDDLIPWMEKEEKDLRKCLFEDIKLVQSERNIKYIPASIGLAEMDAISLSMLLFPTFEYHYLDKEVMPYMLHRYYNDEFLKRLKRGTAVAYLPYELRGAISFLILGERDKALAIMRYILKDRRPLEWNHWAEVISADPSAPVYVGDIPHSWIGAIFVNAARTLFIYEEWDKLFLGAGIDEKWLKEKEGVSVKRLPTQFGEISYSVKNENNFLKIEVTGGATPPNGFVFKSPLPGRRIKSVRMNGEVWMKFSDGEITFEKLPATISAGLE